MKYCKIHGYTNYDAKYCPKCGDALFDYPHCDKCDFELIIPNWDYCPNCSAKRPDNQDRGK